ncbi:MAG TPA: tRNA pseudouridine(55) synthase TruB [Casimicrobiaceae bacterium]|nr:tRNA pseudouridine(55) synthase TruB [Casimicrobiaceae bacterium]
MSDSPSTPISRRRLPRRNIDGVLLLDKPSGITSNAALSRIKRLYNPRKAGHTGTLDPLASGLLPICFGSATRFAQFLLDADKRYTATIRFGVATTTLDAEGDVIATRPVTFARPELEATLARFTGVIRQVPPAHSALKFEGRPHYEYARRGIDVPRPPRDVTIHGLTLVAWRAPDAIVDVHCGKGTYVRSLASDIGGAIGCGAHLAALRRTASGGFDIANAMSLAALEAMDARERDARIAPARVLVAHMPPLRLSPAVATRFRHGEAVAAIGFADGIAAVFEGDVLIGVAEVSEQVAMPRRTVATHEDRALNPVES